MVRRKSATGKGLGFWLLILIVGALIGSITGEIIGLYFQDEASIIHKLFIAGINPGFDARTINFYVLDFAVGFHVKFNVLTLMGFIGAIYLGRLL